MAELKRYEEITRQGVLYRLALTLNLKWSTFLKTPLWELVYLIQHYAESRVLDRLASIEDKFHALLMYHGGGAGEYMDELQRKLFDAITPEEPVPAAERLELMKKHNKNTFEILKKNAR